MTSVDERIQELRSNSTELEDDDKGAISAFFKTPYGRGLLFGMGATTAAAAVTGVRNIASHALQKRAAEELRRLEEEEDEAAAYEGYGIKGGPGSGYWGPRPKEKDKDWGGSAPRNAADVDDETRARQQAAREGRSTALATVPPVPPPAIPLPDKLAEIRQGAFARSQRQLPKQREKAMQALVQDVAKLQRMKLFTKPTKLEQELIKRGDARVEGYARALGVLPEQLNIVAAELRKWEDENIGITKFEQERNMRVALQRAKSKRKIIDRFKKKVGGEIEKIAWSPIQGARTAITESGRALGKRGVQDVGSAIGAYRDSRRGEAPAVLEARRALRDEAGTAIERAGLLDPTDERRLELLRTPENLAALPSKLKRQLSEEEFANVAKKNPQKALALMSPEMQLEAARRVAKHQGDTGAALAGILTRTRAEFGKGINVPTGEYRKVRNPFTGKGTNVPATRYVRDESVARGETESESVLSAAAARRKQLKKDETERTKLGSEGSSDERLLLAVANSMGRGGEYRTADATARAMRRNPPTTLERAASQGKPTKDRLDDAAASLSTPEKYRILQSAQDEDVFSAVYNSLTPDERLQVRRADENRFVRAAVRTVPENERLAAIRRELPGRATQEPKAGPSLRETSDVARAAGITIAGLPYAPLNRPRSDDDAPALDTPAAELVRARTVELREQQRAALRAQEDLMRRTAEEVGAKPGSRAYTAIAQQLGPKARQAGGAFTAEEREFLKRNPTEPAPGFSREWSEGGQPASPRLPPGISDDTLEMAQEIADSYAQRRVKPNMRVLYGDESSAAQPMEKPKFFSKTIEKLRSDQLLKMRDYLATQPKITAAQREKLDDLEVEIERRIQEDLARSREAAPGGQRRTDRDEKAAYFRAKYLEESSKQAYHLAKYQELKVHATVL